MKKTIKRKIRMLVFIALVASMLLGLAIPVVADAQQAQQRVSQLVIQLNNDVKALTQAYMMFPGGNFSAQLIAMATKVQQLTDSAVEAGYPVNPDVFKTLDNINTLASFLTAGSSASVATALAAGVNTAYITLNAIKPPDVTPPVDPPPVGPPVTLTVNPTRSTVYINEDAVGFEAYLINDENYFKLRDLAFALSGTQKQFSTSWDAVAMLGTLTSGRPYVSEGQEMIQGDGQPKSATLNEGFAVLLDGELTEIRAYLIMDNNFVRIRDILMLFDIGWSYDAATQDIKIDTSKPYVD